MWNERADSPACSRSEMKARVRVPVKDVHDVHDQFLFPFETVGAVPKPERI
jgi:hypothetical protein